MQKENDALDLGELNDILAKIKRSETVLNAKIDLFVKSEKALAETSKQLTLEITEIKGISESIPQTIRNCLQENIKPLNDRLLPMLARGFQDQNLGFMQSSLQKAQDLEFKIKQTVSLATTLVSSQKRDLTIQGIGFIIAFCVSSLLTAGGIFYLFPQYYHINYEITPPMSQAILWGEVLLENQGKLNPDQKEFFVKKAEDKVRLSKKRKP